MQASLLSLHAGQTGKIFCHITTADGALPVLVGAVDVGGTPRMMRCADSTATIDPLPVGCWPYEMRCNGVTVLHGELDVLPSPLSGVDGEVTWDAYADLTTPLVQVNVVQNQGPAGRDGKSPYVRDGRLYYFDDAAGEWRDGGAVQGAPGRDGESPSAEDVAVEMMKHFAVEMTMEGPTASFNGNANYAQIGSFYLPQGLLLTRFGWRCRFDNMDGCCTDPVYLGIWELAPEGSEWLQVGVSLDSQVQAVNKDVMWEFELGTVKLSGRPIRCCLLSSRDDEWRQDLIMAPRTNNAADDETKLWYNDRAWASVPKFFLRGYKMADAVAGGVMGGGLQLAEGYDPDDHTKAISGRVLQEAIAAALANYSCSCGGNTGGNTGGGNTGGGNTGGGNTGGTSSGGNTGGSTTGSSSGAPVKVTPDGSPAVEECYKFALKLTSARKIPNPLRSVVIPVYRRDCPAFDVSKAQDLEASLITLSDGTTHRDQHVADSVYSSTAPYAAEQKLEASFFDDGLVLSEPLVWEEGQELHISARGSYNYVGSNIEFVKENKGLDTTWAPVPGSYSSTGKAEPVAATVGAIYSPDEEADIDPLLSAATIRNDGAYYTVEVAASATKLGAAYSNLAYSFGCAQADGTNSNHAPSKGYASYRVYSNAYSKALITCTMEDKLTAKPYKMGIIADLGTATASEAFPLIDVELRLDYVHQAYPVGSGKYAYQISIRAQVYKNGRAYNNVTRALQSVWCNFIEESDGRYLANREQSSGYEDTVTLRVTDNATGRVYVAKGTYNTGTEVREQRLGVGVVEMNG